MNKGMGYPISKEERRESDVRVMAQLALDVVGGMIDELARHAPNETNPSLMMDCSRLTMMLLDEGAVGRGSGHYNTKVEQDPDYLLHSLASILGAFAMPPSKEE